MFRFTVLSIMFTVFSPLAAETNKQQSIYDLVSKSEFLTYNNVADFIDASPKVTVVVDTQPEDIAEYGNNVVKSLTGSDCDRDGKMDDNATCNAVFFKLWMKYKR